jgi:hypothetical protein
MSEPRWLTAEQVKAITDAVLREVTTSITWDELGDRTIADLCSMNQDALIDDLYEDHPDDRPHRDGMVAHIKTYDALLGTSRAAEIPEAKL